MAEARVLVTADVHIDGGLDDKRRNSETGRPRAWDSTYEIWLAICRRAIEDKVDAVVVPGDLFRNSWPSAEAVEMIRDGLALLEQAGLPVVLGNGNHELISLPHKYRSPIEHFADMKNVTIARRTPELVVLGSGLQIVCFPWPKRQMLLEKWEYEYLTPEESDDLTGIRMAELIEEVSAQVDTARGPALLTGHATVSTATLQSGRRGSERSLADVSHEPVIAMSALDDGPWQRILLGHVHMGQDAGKRGAYVGAPDRIDRGDEGRSTSFVISHIPDDGSPGWDEKVPTASRRFATIRVPSGFDAAEIERLLPERPEELIATFDLPPGSDAAFETEIRRAAERFSMAFDINNPPRPRVERERIVVSEDVNPSEGLAVWLDQQGGFDEGQRARLLSKTGELLEAVLG
jgi:DNA repair exonuclease SbcCD nuclease subunit